LDASDGLARNTDGLNERPIAVVLVGESQAGARLSRSNWSDHSAGAPRKAAMPAPRGSRPSMAALTIAGAMNAIEIVMLTWRTLHLWRSAIASTVIVPEMISSSQARPRAIDLRSDARRSNLIGRTWCRSVAAGNRISLNRFDGGLVHGISREGGSIYADRLVCISLFLQLAGSLQPNRQHAFAYFDTGDIREEPASIYAAFVLGGDVLTRLLDRLDHRPLDLGGRNTDDLGGRTAAQLFGIELAHVMHGQVSIFATAHSLRLK
jgi:hypothetical protein